MNLKIKSCKSKFLLAGLVALVPVSIDAKAATTPVNDTTDANKEMVQVAYRKVDKRDILGGVAVVDVAQLLKKNYINPLFGLFLPIINPKTIQIVSTCSLI